MVLVTGRHGRLTTKDRLALATVLVAARGATRDTAMGNPHRVTPDPRHADSLLPNHRPAVPNPRISA